MRVSSQFPLANLLFCCTSLPPEQRDAIDQTLSTLGAGHTSHLTNAVTHLITGNTNTPKYAFIAQHRPDVRVILPDFVDAVKEVWLRGEDQPEAEVRAWVADLETRYRPPVFWGISACVTGFTNPEFRDALHTLMSKNGCDFNFCLSPKVTHLIAEEPKGKKYEFARRWGAKVVSIEWVHDSLKRGMRLEESYFDITLPPGERGKGACVAFGPGESDSSGKRKRGDDEGGEGESRGGGGATSPGRGRGADDEDDTPREARKLRKAVSMRLAEQAGSLWQDIAAPSGNRRVQLDEWDSGTAGDDHAGGAERSGLDRDGPAAKKPRSDMARSKSVVGVDGEPSGLASSRAGSSAPRTASMVATRPGTSGPAAGNPRPKTLFNGIVMVISGFTPQQTAILESHLVSHGARVFHQKDLRSGTSPSSRALLALSDDALSSGVLLLPHDAPVPTYPVLDPQSLREGFEPTVAERVLPKLRIATQWWIERCLHSRHFFALPEPGTAVRALGGMCMTVPFRRIGPGAVEGWGSRERPGGMGGISCTGFEDMELRHFVGMVEMLGGEVHKALLPDTAVLVCADKYYRGAGGAGAGAGAGSVGAPEDGDSPSVLGDETGDAGFGPGGRPRRWELLDRSVKMDFAIQHGIPAVASEWAWDAVAAGRAPDPWDYCVCLDRYDEDVRARVEAQRRRRRSRGRRTISSGSGDGGGGGGGGGGENNASDGIKAPTLRPKTGSSSSLARHLSIQQAEGRANAGTTRASIPDSDPPFLPSGGGSTGIGSFASRRASGGVSRTGSGREGREGRSFSEFVADVGGGAWRRDDVGGGGGGGAGKPKMVRNLASAGRREVMPDDAFSHDVGRDGSLDGGGGAKPAPGFGTTGARRPKNPFFTDDDDDEEDDGEGESEMVDDSVLLDAERRHPFVPVLGRADSRSSVGVNLNASSVGPSGSDGTPAATAAATPGDQKRGRGLRVLPPGDAFLSDSRKKEKEKKEGRSASDAEGDVTPLADTPIHLDTPSAVVEDTPFPGVKRAFPPVVGDERLGGERDGEERVDGEGALASPYEDDFLVPTHEPAAVLVPTTVNLSSVPAGAAAGAAAGPGARRKNRRGKLGRNGSAVGSGVLAPVPREGCVDANSNPNLGSEERTGGGGGGGGADGGSAPDLLPPNSNSNSNPNSSGVSLLGLGPGLGLRHRRNGAFGTTASRAISTSTVSALSSCDSESIASEFGIGVGATLGAGAGAGDENDTPKGMRAGCTGAGAGGNGREDGDDGDEEEDESLGRTGSLASRGERMVSLSESQFFPSQGFSIEDDPVQRRRRELLMMKVEGSGGR